MEDKATRPLTEDDAIKFAEWILNNCTFWGNEWFMYKGYRHTTTELYSIYKEGGSNG